MDEFKTIESNIWSCWDEDVRRYNCFRMFTNKVWELEMEYAGDTIYGDLDIRFEEVSNELQKLFDVMKEKLKELRPKGAYIENK